VGAHYPDNALITLGFACRRFLRWKEPTNQVTHSLLSRLALVQETTHSRLLLLLPPLKEFVCGLSLGIEPIRIGSAFVPVVELVGDCLLPSLELAGEGFLNAP